MRHDIMIRQEHTGFVGNPTFVVEPRMLFHWVVGWHILRRDRQPLGELWQPDGH